jgi:glycosyltransferase involved in cell wall biosynthesis
MGNRIPLKKVMILAPSHNVGGFETKLDTLVRHINRSRFKPCVLLLYPYYKAKKIPEAVRNRQRDFFSWPGIRTLELTMKNRFDFFQIFRIAALLQRLKPDVVLFFALGAGPFLVPIASRLAGVPFLVRAQDTVLDGLYPKPLRPLDRLLLSLTQRIVVPSIFLKRVFVRGFNVRPEKVVVIPNGIDLSRFGRIRPDFALKRSLGIGKKTQVVGMIANLVPIKDHAVLFEAVPRVLRECSDVLFLLAGDGPLRKDLEIRAEALGISKHVHFLGYRNDVEALVSLFDVGVLCSKVETHGISLIEMMASGVPVIAPNVGGIPEIVRDGETGRLVPQGDPAALAQAVIRLLKNPILARQLGNSGKQYVHRQFSVAAMARSFESILALGGPA